MNFKMIVVTHKMFDDTVLPEGYQVIYVGEDKNIKLKSNWLRADIGDNIDTKHPYYSELTGQYWFWKNYKGSEQIMGLCHYRRFFFDYKKSSCNWSQDILTSDEAEKILSKHKVIMSITSVKNPDEGRLYKSKDNSKEDYWVILENIIKQFFPDYLKSFQKVLYGKYVVWCNMFVASKTVFDNYCQWLFDVLNKFDDELEKQNKPRRLREDGYRSEDLLMVYMYKNFSKKDIYRMEVRNVEQDPMCEYKSRTLKSKIIKSIRRHRFLLMFVRKIRILYLLFARRNRD